MAKLPAKLTEDLTCIMFLFQQLQRTFSVSFRIIVSTAAASADDL